MTDLYDEDSILNDIGKNYDILTTNALLPIMDRAEKENINLRELLEVINVVAHDLVYMKILNWDCKVVDEPKWNQPYDITET